MGTSSVASAQVTHGGINDRWREINGNLPFPESILSAAAQAAYNEGVADGRAGSGPLPPGVNGAATGERRDPATGKWCRLPFWGGAERIRIDPDNIAATVQFILLNLTGGQGASERACLEADIAIASIFHELCHVMVNTGKMPDKTACWEYDCTCAEIWFFCKIMESDPQYQPGGVKKAAGDAFKEFKHKAKDTYLFLKGPQ